MANGLLVFLVLANVYLLLLYVAARTGLMQRWNLGLLGPILMVRTNRGKGAIEWLAKAKGLWRGLGSFGVVFTLASMFLFTGYLVWQVPLLFELPAEAAPGLSEIFVIPGLNPFVPLGYGVVALILAVGIHEFSHGVAARVEGMRVKSLGVLFLIVPIGAFVEPDEDDLKASPRKARMKVFAAGVTSNFVTAALLGVVFSAVLVAAVEPVADGVPVIRAVDHSPAQDAGIGKGWVLTAVNGTTVPDYDSFRDAMRETRPGQNVTINASTRGEPRSVHLCLADRAQFSNGSDPGPGVDFCALSGAKGDAFLGIEPLPLSPSGFRDLLANPFGSGIDFVTFLALPLLSLSPIEGAVADLYVTPWHGTFLGDDGYWVLANGVYWVFWISFLLALFNALPAVPLDGGHLFRDFADGVLKQLAPAMKEGSRGAAVKALSVAFTSLIVLLILLHIFAPRLGSWFG